MTAADRPTEPPVECVAVDRDERCLCPGGPASHRPSPPAPAAEDDAVEKAARVWHAEDATEPRAWDALSDDERGWYIATTRKSLDAAGVSALRAEVAEWRRVATEQTRMERDRAEAAEAEVERLRERVGEVEEDRDDRVQVAGERAGQRDEARQQVAALRAGIEALLRGAYIRGWDLTVRADDLHALLAGSGDVESPAPNVATSEGRDKAVARSGEQPDCGTPEETDGCGACERCCRPAPVVPDSTGLRERLWEAIVKVRDAAPRLPDDADTDDIVDAVLAVVGQGVTAEPIKIEWGVVVDDDGTTETYESREAAERMAVYQGGVCEVVRIETWPHSPAVVRSGEQGGEA